MARSKVLVALALTVVLGGCITSTRSRESETGARVELTKANFRVLKASAEGRSTGFYLFEFIPIMRPSVRRAMRELRGDYEVAGEATALINVAEDRWTWHFLLFSIPRLAISADIIEFTGD